MKHTIAIILAVLLLTACSKNISIENPPGKPDTSKKFPVQFSVTGFSQDIDDLSRSSVVARNMTRTPADSLAKSIHYLLYSVFDADTHLKVRSIYQKCQDSSFGLIRDTLPAGKYVITVTASKDSVFSPPVIYDPNSPIPPLYDLNYGFSAANPPGTDVFYKKIEVSVDDAVNQQFTLKRIVSKLKINIKDNMPYTIRYIQMVMIPDSQVVGTSYLPAYFHFETGISYGKKNEVFYLPYTIPVPDAAKGKPNFQFETYVLNTGTLKITPILYAIDTGNAGVARKDIRNVTLEANRKTTLSGYLFNVPGSGANVDLESTWRADSIYAEF